MYVKSIVLDGFKSYGQRTEINGFDPKFNAITGLNGSGKSNILDSICFVLGITNLSNVRASSLQDLIYKSGNSGIRKATVSITFDNRDRSQCPVGFQDCDEITVTRQIVMGGKNKYMINGATVQNKRVQDLFCSVQLNVNNPHFLIMQGRITKVLNMKPLEILSMLEEAAGTRMYETKRTAAQRTIEKKDAKLAELNDHISNDIGPKLDRLREDRRMLHEYQRVERELDQAQTMHIGWQYREAQAGLEAATASLQSKQAELEDMQRTVRDNEARATDLDRQLEELRADTAAGNALREAEAQLRQEERALAAATAAENNAQQNIGSKDKERQQLARHLADDEAALGTRRAELAAMGEATAGLRQAEEAAAAELTRAQRQLEAASAGMQLGEDGQAVTLQEQLMGYKQQASEAATARRQAALQLQHCRAQLTERRQEAGAASADYERSRREADALDRQVQEARRRLATLAFEPSRLQQLGAHVRDLRTQCRSLRDQLDRFEASHPQATFQYHDPEPRFERRRVKGLVCNLLKVHEADTAAALAVVAGARLFDVVVDSDLTSKKLLQAGGLARRTTFIPLNKIRGGPVPPHVLQLAQGLVGADRCRTALSLLRYDPELQPAMEYVFGRTLVCSDMEAARRVAFHDQIRLRCVTLDGDVVDPSGVLTGGSRPRDGPLLALIEENRERQVRLAGLERELADAERQLTALERTRDQHAGLRHALELDEHKHALVLQCLHQTAYHQQRQELEALQASAAELSQLIEQAERNEREAQCKAADIERRISDSRNDRDAQLKRAEAELRQLRQQAEDSRGRWQRTQQEHEAMRLEVAELEQAIAHGIRQMEVCEQDASSLRLGLAELTEATASARKRVADMQARIRELKAVAAAKTEESQRRLDQVSQLKATNADLDLEIKKQSHELAELRARLADWTTRERDLHKKIKLDDPRVQEAQRFTRKEVDDLLAKIKNASEHLAVLGRTMNPKAQSMLEQEEKMYSSLLKRRRTVENDKRKLMAVMADLDKKKVETLRVAHEQISRDFGSIFSTLLPGTNAKLDKLEGRGITDGIEIKVSIGDIWKESLSELSGGQKSLVALSLILAMLLFKPAPIYILDEVDAALDLSHTQNIGNMLRLHFKYSQFIIVSLKDGMFNNANVLYKTKFVDGMSAVQRTVNANLHAR